MTAQANLRLCVSPLCTVHIRAFRSARRPRRFVSTIKSMATNNGSRQDGPLEGMINSLSVAVTNFQPLNDGKKWLAKVQAGDYPEGEMSAKLDQYIQNNPVVVFSWSRCPFCVKAKSALKSMNADFLAVELDQMPEGSALRAELAKRTNRTSMPNIWISQKPIGGCNDGPGLLTLERKGELRPMLQSAGAL